MKILVKSFRLVIFDALLAVVGIFVALFVRMDGDMYSPYFSYLTQHILEILVIQVLVFWLFGLYHISWRHASIIDGVRIYFAVSVVCAVSFVLFILVQHQLPMSVFFLFGLFDLVTVAGLRYYNRLAKSFGYRLKQRVNQSTKRILIVGAGEAGAMLAREIQNQHNSDTHIVGFIDDDENKKDKLILGIRVLGNRESISLEIDKNLVTDIYIAMPSISGKITRDLAEICRATGALVKILPSLFDVAGGKVTVSSLRNIAIEDLLQRAPLNITSAGAMNYYAGKRILITGAGGSIGSEISRQLAREGPERLILLGRGENSIYGIEQELQKKYQSLNFRTVIADVRDEQALEAVFARYRPNIVFHAAAHKHVPLMEHQPAEAYNNNVVGTYTVGRLAAKYNVERFVLVSTDKAVNPTNIMGASKRMAELTVKALNISFPATKFCAVRFGNVLGSRGSVVPLFRQQIADGGPVNVTHPDIRRYFMTIPEACQLVIRAGTLTAGGETFLLNMGEPIKISDLALEMIRLSGLEPHVDIEIKYTGLRPGEKLFEELWKDTDSNVKIVDDSLYILKEEFCENCLELLGEATFVYDREQAITRIKKWVPEYQKGG
ncbi:MAG: nucleoside-diphosphate sugar epimerase/dehydratase [Bacillota bacterium]